MRSSISSCYVDTNLAKLFQKELTHWAAQKLGQPKLFQKELHWAAQKLAKRLKMGLPPER